MRCVPLQWVREAVNCTLYLIHAAIVYTVWCI